MIGILRGASLVEELNARFWRPTTDWAQGGPLLEKYQIELLTIKIGSDSVKHWCAFFHADSRKYEKCHTALIAICRAIVAAKLGDVVLVPEELEVVK